VTWHLRESLSYCLIDGTAIFLDLAADRYFRLDETTNDAFLSFIAGEDATRLIPALEAADVIESGGPTRPVASLIPIQPLRRSAAVTTGGFRLGDVAHALLVQKHAERRLASRSLREVVTHLRRVKSKCGAHDIAPGSPAARTLRAFEYAKVLRSAADRCLPRSIALGLCLARIGVRCDVIIGVKLGPFAAHCWVQAEDEVLNDSVEEVARFTPILVV
jgi:hypothetical protein